MFLTDVLFSSPRLRFSEAQKCAVLKWAKDMHARDVPTLGGLKKCRQEIKDLVGNSTRKVTSPSGNIFYLNDIGNAIAKVCRLNFYFCILNLNSTLTGLLEPYHSIIHARLS